VCVCVCVCVRERERERERESMCVCVCVFCKFPVRFHMFKYMYTLVYGTAFLVFGTRNSFTHMIPVYTHEHICIPVPRDTGLHPLHRRSCSVCQKGCSVHQKGCSVHQRSCSKVHINISVT